MAIANGGTITAGALATPVTDYLTTVPTPLPAGSVIKKKKAAADYTVVATDAYAVTADGRATFASKKLEEF